MKRRNHAGQASRLSHLSNQPLERNTVSDKLVTGWRPVLLWLALLLAPIAAPAQSYSIDWYKIAGGGGTSTNGAYTVSGTIGQPDASGALTGGSYSLTGGFWSLICVVQTAGAPPLTVSHSGNSVIISWPSASSGFVLQQNDNLATGSWTPANGLTISDDGTTKSITITSPAGNLFFRLFHP
jgi:hypothetical protein